MISRIAPRGERTAKLHGSDRSHDAAVDRHSATSATQRAEMSPTACDASEAILERFAIGDRVRVCDSPAGAPELSSMGGRVIGTDGRWCCVSLTAWGVCRWFRASELARMEGQP